MRLPRIYEKEEGKQANDTDCIFTANKYTTYFNKCALHRLNQDYKVYL